MAETSVVLSLPYIQAAQAQKHVTHNEAIRLLDVIVQPVVLDADRTAPPAGPAEGDRHVVAAGASGAWTGQDGAIASWEGAGWAFAAPQAGWQVRDLGTDTTLIFDGTAWAADGLGTPETLGINASADTTNRLSVASPAVLFTHEGAGHQLKINKAAAADTASLLFQTAFSGRAEMGTTGSDDFAIKVSADGSAFTTAFSFDGATGIASGQAVQQSADDTTAGRLMRADYGYGPGNVLGTVTETGGLPTGAVIEHGTNANGDYVRFADGTQICMNSLQLNYEATSKIGATWTFPVPFAGAPTAVTGTMNTNSLSANVTPDLDEMCGLLHANTNASQTKLVQYRVAGTTNFASGDFAVCRACAIGRWF